MSNVLGNYDPIFYAAEALEWLRKTLGFGSRVYRGYDPSPTQQGSTITLRRPMTFTATTMPASATDLTPDTVTITLSKWMGTVFTLTDKELAYTKEQIIEEHVKPAAYSVADQIDQSLAGLYNDIPWSLAASSSLAVADITALRKQLSLNMCPMNDGRLYLALSPTHMKEALDLAAFTQWQGAGNQGAESQQSGLLGEKFGFKPFENQNVQSHTPGTAADATGALTAAAAKGASSISFNGVTAAGTFNQGDTFVLAGSTQQYAFTANQTADGTGAVTGATISPPLVRAQAQNDVITITFQPSSGGAAKEVSLGFHRDAFALAMGVLPDNLPGIDVKTVSDAQSGLSVRARRWSDGTNAAVYVGIDALWGVKTLNPNMACRLYHP